jgi:hypothetical protein
MIIDSPLDWKSWKLPEWNAALVKAVFLDPTQSGRRLQRITASERFLAQVAGAKDSEHDEVKSHFLQCFGTSANQIKRHFEWTSGIERCLREGIPNFFGALYLTLLAGSADEETVAIGRFPMRFAILMANVAFPENYHFHDLPRMWETLARWSQSQRSKGGDCRELILPHPQHEVRIGYSKRLAFPRYKDEKALSILLSSAKGFEELSAEYVNKKVSQSLANFSESFRDEYREFASHFVFNRIIDAFETPFWGAVQDIVWDIDISEAKKNGRYDLVVDVTDLMEPWLTLLADDAGVLKLKDDCGEATRYLDDSYQRLVPKGAGAWVPEKLRSIAAKNKAFANSRLGRALACRQIILLPDEVGQLRVGGKYFDGCRVAFLVARTKAETLLQDIDGLGIRATLYPPTDGYKDDAILVIPRLEQAALHYLKRYPEGSIYEKLLASQSQGAMSLSGGAWQGQLLLLNPASLPIAYVAEAVSGEYEILGKDAVIICTGKMEQVEDPNGFRVPPKDMASANDAFALKITLGCGGDRRFAKKVPGMSLLREGRYVGLRNPARWMICGPLGTLEDLPQDGYFRSDYSCSIKVSEDVAPLPSGVLQNLAFRPVNTGAQTHLLVQPHKSLHIGLRWLWDALSLRFQGAQALSYRDILTHAEPAAVASDTSPYMLIRLLEASGWLVRLSSRSFRSISFAPGERELIILGDTPSIHARLIGPISSSVAEELGAWLGEDEDAGFLLPSSEALSCGALRLELRSKDRLCELASKLGAKVLTPAEVPNPMGNRKRLSFGVRARTDFLRNADGRYESWRWPNWNWEELLDATKMADGSLVRHKDRRNPGYFVPYGKDVFSTNSEVWARWLTSAIRNGAIGEISHGGEVMFDEEVLQVPSSLSRWWMLVGGGAIFFGNNSALHFVGQGKRQVAVAMSDWVAGVDVPPSTNVAMERRKLALKLSKRRDNRHVTTY